MLSALHGTVNNGNGFHRSLDENLREFLSRVEKVRSTGNGKWRCCCPAHDDRNPSLDVTLVPDDKVLIYCQSARCSFESIVTAVGMSTADFNANRRPSSNGRFDPAKYLAWYEQQQRIRTEREARAAAKAEPEPRIENPTKHSEYDAIKAAKRPLTNAQRDVFTKNIGVSARNPAFDVVEFLPSNYPGQKGRKVPRIVIPEVYGCGSPKSLLLRDLNGKKLNYGGRGICFTPKCLNVDSTPIVGVSEGWSDFATLTDAGLNSIGAANREATQIEYAIEAMQKFGPPNARMWICGDAGKEEEKKGAYEKAARAEKILGVHVPVIFPDAKDFRIWLNAQSAGLRGDAFIERRRACGDEFRRRILEELKRPLTVVVAERETKKHTALHAMAEALLGDFLDGPRVRPEAEPSSKQEPKPLCKRARAVEFRNRFSPEQRVCFYSCRKLDCEICNATTKRMLQFVFDYHLKNYHEQHPERHVCVFRVSSEDWKLARKNLSKVKAKLNKRMAKELAEDLNKRAAAPLDTNDPKEVLAFARVEIARRQREQGEMGGQFMAIEDEYRQDCYVVSSHAPPKQGRDAKWMTPAEAAERFNRAISLIGIVPPHAFKSSHEWSIKAAIESRPIEEWECLKAKGGCGRRTTIAIDGDHPNADRRTCPKCGVMTYQRACPKGCQDSTQNRRMPTTHRPVCPECKLSMEPFVVWKRRGKLRVKSPGDVFEIASGHRVEEDNVKPGRNGRSYFSDPHVTVKANETKMDAISTSLTEGKFVPELSPDQLFRTSPTTPRTGIDFFNLGGRK